MSKPVKSRIKLLVEALESGKYKQGKGSLRPDKKEFCCLGVACDVYRKQTGKGRWLKGLFIVGNEDEENILHPTVQQWFGFENDNPVLSYGGGDYATAAHMNDTGTTFSEIAGLFRRKYGLPVKK